MEYRLLGLLLLSFCACIVWVCVRPFTGARRRPPAVADLAAIPVLAALVACSAAVGFGLLTQRRSETITVAEITSMTRTGQIIDADGRRLAAHTSLRERLTVGGRYRCKIIPLALVPVMPDIAASCRPVPPSVALTPRAR